MSKAVTTLNPTWTHLSGEGIGCEAIEDRANRGTTLGDGDRRGISRHSHLASLAALLAREAREIIPQHSAGFTFDPRSWSFPEFQENVYIVSLEGYERRLDPLPTQEDVRTWLHEVAHLLCRLDVYVGGWLDPKIWRLYLDVSAPVRGRDRAELIGRITGQSTIYHPATGTVISL